MASKAVQTATFRGRRYRVTRHIYDGLVDVPGKPDWELNVDPRLRGKRELVVWIHEAAHAERPDLPEEAIERLAENTGRLLWRLGYHRKRT